MKKKIQIKKIQFKKEKNEVRKHENSFLEALADEKNHKVINFYLKKIITRSPLVKIAHSPKERVKEMERIVAGSRFT